jgi:hypothetical protein
MTPDAVHCDLDVVSNLGHRSTIHKNIPLIQILETPLEYLWKRVCSRYSLHSTTSFGDTIRPKKRLSYLDL